MRAKGRVTGDREIIANMRRVRNAVGGRALDRDMAEALDPMREQTVENARRRRQPGNPPGGHLDQGVVVRKMESRGQNFRVFWLSFTKRARKIAHLVEFGTAPHWQPRRGIMHPGARPFPFARPAFESTKDETVNALGILTWQRIAASLVGVKKQ